MRVALTAACFALAGVAAIAAETLDAPLVGHSRREIQEAYVRVVELLSPEDRNAFAETFTAIDLRFDRRVPTSLSAEQKEAVYVATFANRTPRELIIIGSFLILSDIREARAAGDEAPDLRFVEASALDYLRRYSSRANKPAEPTEGTRTSDREIGFIFTLAARLSAL